jgi:antitoxin ParD1/3/4
MEAYRTYITITDPQQVVLRDVPFQAGQRVEVLILTYNVDMVQEMKALFKETQSLPQVKTLSDEDIAAEVVAYRSGQ